MDSHKTFPVVGIGSSAGGLEALRILLDNMPANSGMAFVLVSHLAPNQESNLAEILRRHTAMPVHVAADAAAIDPNNIYVCPPNQTLTVEGGRLRLTPLRSDRQRKPIDLFLASLAEAYDQAAVGILLSGSDSDGALGIKAIKERGGLTLAQGSDGTAPMHRDMPDAAIATGFVDIIASVEEMPQRLGSYAQQFGTLEADVANDTERLSAGHTDGYKPIYRMLLDQIGHDFSGYKDKTFARRVRRRMQVLQVAHLDDYVAVLADRPEEVTLLFRDLLVSVTNFFRDPDAFESLASTVVPQLMEGKGAADTIRVWVPGCATGEEVYSLAILMREYMEKIRTPPKLQIFATDIDEPALAIARNARYPEPLLENVSRQRLEKYFIDEGGSYAVSKVIRDVCLFSTHSVVRDPPFSRVDMISCRNLLIYLGADFQGQVIPVFHFALRPGGYLFLGTSENITRHTDLFSPLDKKSRIFQRRDHAVTPLRLPFFTPYSRALPGAHEKRTELSTSAVNNLRLMVEARVLERFAPAHVVVNSEGDILHFSPRTGKYLEPPTGLPNRQLLSMARRGLRLDLRAVLRDAVETRRRVERHMVRVDDDEHAYFVNLAVEPLSVDPDPLFLVLFQDAAPPSPSLFHDDGSEDKHFEQLEQELRDTRERLQATVEEYETAVEELKSSNEELQSINEELQSTNEELETSKEELQSVNEELHTVNSELNAKVLEVDRAHTDLRNIFDSTQIATVFLDKDLVIRSFTPAVGKIFNVISSDRGRPLTDIANVLENVDITRELQTVFERNEIIERKVRRIDGKADYLMRLIPYYGPNKGVEGVVVTFVDITELTASDEYQRRLVDEINGRVGTILATVSALAEESEPQSGTSNRFIKEFTARITAMSSTYALLSGKKWKNIALRDLAKHQLAAVQIAAKRVSIEGPDIFLNPRAAVALGVVFSELIGTSVEDGTLSGERGQVHIAWSTGKPGSAVTDLHWRESGGPKAKKAKPDTGMDLIRREVEQTLGGTAVFIFTENGLEARMSIPFDGNFTELSPR